MRASMTRGLLFALACTALLAVACGGSTSSPAIAAIAAPDDSALAAIVDENPDPHTLEVHLDARVATKVFGASPPTAVWSYNGSIPGPLLDLNVGDRLIVHFTNHLPESTTIHWHGVRLPAAMDGTPAMQSPIEPGASFDYDFVVKDPGLFWFHPHMRSDVQVNKGLYGALRVRGANEPASDDEKILVLDDIKLKADGSIPDYLDDTSRMMGRGGNTVLVNGTANATLRVRPNATVRLRIVNTANGRFFKLHLPGVALRVVGTDGGPIAHPYDTDALLIAPGERYDVFLRIPDAADTSLVMTTQAYDRGHETGLDPPLDVATVRVEGQRVATPATLPAQGAAIEALPTPNQTLPMRLDEKSVDSGGFAFTINDVSYPNIPTIDVPLGEMRAIALDNTSEMDHPFHLHGLFFQAIARGGVAVPESERVWKDTIIVPMKSTLTLAARFDALGMWMYHCHILEHAEGGMMGDIMVR